MKMKVILGTITVRKLRDGRFGIGHLYNGKWEIFRVAGIEKFSYVTREKAEEMAELFRMKKPVTRLTF